MEKSINQTTQLIGFLLKYIGLLIAAGAFIGLLHAHDWLVATSLGGFLLLILYRKRNMPKDEKRIYSLGLLLTALLGTLCEHWGSAMAIGNTMISVPAGIFRSGCPLPGLLHLHLCIVSNKRSLL